ncbi:DUF998 domain-containing protein [Arthrobacter sp. ATA002]|uniref:DUF998 domain-containing protein n=1 Tax=Arthrobacter sp. ATA002 TaxID=2991715 RepID=UPI0022A718F0|nr:DUF998 domain-containing protein [Arthrobacter sp. ATA002]WAP51800.1 DUF998 domain-containing protein [Arthrobacter sp. ATA002]
MTYPAQIIAAAQWPRPYSWVSNTISDLGFTACATFDPGTRAERYVCSPAHLLANAGTVANGLLLAVGAVLLWSVWPRQRTGHAAMVLLALSGFLLVLVGVFPWDVDPLLHNLSALLQAPVQWAGMIVLVFALRGNPDGRGASVLTIACLVISIAGFVLFVDAVGGGPSAAIGLGLTERISFDILTLWSAAIGVLLLTSKTSSGSTA